MNTLKMKQASKTMLIIVLSLFTLLWAQKIDSLLTKQYCEPGDIVGLEILEYRDNAFLYFSYYEPYLGMVSKIDKDYNIVWSEIIGDTIDYGQIYDVQKTKDNLFILLGKENDSCVLIQIDTSINVIWKKVFGAIEYNSYSKVKQTSDNGFLFIASIRSLANSSYDGWIVKTDEKGEMVWQTTVGDTGNIWLYDFVELGENKGYVCIGTYFLSNYYLQSFIVNLDINGNILNTAFIDSSGEINAICDITDTTFIFGGITKSGNTFKGWRYGKLDINGNVFWKKETYEMGHPRVYTICKAYDNSFLLGGDMAIEGAGHFNTILQINEQGDSLGAYHFPTDHHGSIFNINRISQNRFAAAARMRNATTNDDLRFSILKLNYPPFFTVTSGEMNDSIFTFTKYSDTVAAQDSFPNDQARYHFFMSPSPGMKIDSISGKISWQVQSGDTGVHNIGVLARDRIEQTDSLWYTLTVLPNPNSFLSKTPPEDSLVIPVNKTIRFSLKLNPHIFNLSDATYIWTMNNVQVGTISSYRLTPDTSMIGKSYKINCIVSDSIFQDSLSWKITIDAATEMKDINTIELRDVSIRLLKRKSITIFISCNQNVIKNSHLEIYSLCGRKVLHLNLNNLRAGINRINIEPFNLTSNLYIVKLHVGDKRLNAKIVLTL